MFSRIEQMIKVLLCKLIRRRRKAENLDVLNIYIYIYGCKFPGNSLSAGERRAETSCVYISTFDSGKIPCCVHTLCDVQVNTYIQILEPLFVVLQSLTSLTISKWSFKVQDICWVMWGFECKNYSLIYYVK
jgi:hypothetical protein